MMNSRSIRYRDTWAAPGSQLFEALESGDRAKADQIYIKCEIDRRIAEGELPEHIYECLPGGKFRLLTLADHVLRGLDGPLLKPLYGRVINTNIC